MESKIDFPLETVQVTYKGVSFPDCVENSFLRFLELIGPEKCKVPNIVAFFKQHPELPLPASEYSLELRNEWVALLSGLPNIQYRVPSVGCDIIAGVYNIIQVFRYLFPLFGSVNPVFLYGGLYGVMTNDNIYDIFDWICDHQLEIELISVESTDFRNRHGYTNVTTLIQMNIKRRIVTWKITSQHEFMSAHSELIF